MYLTQRHVLQVEREDYRMALMCATEANFSMALDRKRFPDGLSPAVFLGKAERAKPEQTDVQQLAIFERIARQAKS